MHCTAMHCIVLQSGGTDLAWIMRDSARAVPPGLGESRPGLDVAEKLEVSTLKSVVSTLKSKVTELGTEIGNIKSQIRELKVKKPSDGEQKPCGWARSTTTTAGTRRSARRLLACTITVATRGTRELRSP